MKKTILLAIIMIVAATPHPTSDLKIEFARMSGCLDIAAKALDAFDNEQKRLTRYLQDNRLKIGSQISNSPETKRLLTEMMPAYLSGVIGMTQSFEGFTGQLGNVTLILLNSGLVEDKTLPCPSSLSK